VSLDDQRSLFVVAGTHAADAIKGGTISASADLKIRGSTDLPGNGLDAVGGTTVPCDLRHQGQ
jgi:hypothetical protein